MSIRLAAAALSLAALFTGIQAQSLDEPVDHFLDRMQAIADRQQSGESLTVTTTRSADVEGTTTLRTVFKREGTLLKLRREGTQEKRDLKTGKREFTAVSVVSNGAHSWEVREQEGQETIYRKSARVPNPLSLRDYRQLTRGASLATVGRPEDLDGRRVTPLVFERLAAPKTPSRTTLYFDESIGLPVRTVNRVESLGADNVTTLQWTRLGEPLPPGITFDYEPPAGAWVEDQTMATPNVQVRPPAGPSGPASPPARP